MPRRLCILLFALAAAVHGKPEGDYFAALTYAESVQLALQKNFAIEGASYDPLDQPRQTAQFGRQVRPRPDPRLHP